MAMSAQAPPGVDPVAYLNWLAQVQAMQQQQQSKNANRQSRDQTELMRELLGQSQGRYMDARQDNENRYLDILQGLGITRDNYLSGIKGYGESQRGDLGRSYDVDLKNRMSGLADRGLSGTTIRGSEQTTNKRERDNAMGRLDDRLTGMRLDADERLSGKVFDFMERKTDAYPDPINNLIQQAGSAIGGSAMGGTGARPAFSMDTRIPMTGLGRTMVSPGGSSMGNAGPANPEYIRPNVSSSRAMPVLRPAAPAAAPVATRQNTPQRQGMDMSPAEKIQRQILTMGADPWASDAHNLVFNPEAGVTGGFGDPNSFKSTQVVQGWQNARPGVNVMQGKPQFGSMAMQTYLPDYTTMGDYSGYRRPRPRRPRRYGSQTAAARPSVARPGYNVGDFNNPNQFGSYV
jgi:hypothetical protein